MKSIKFIFCILMFSLPLFARDILILKNGKRMVVENGYKIVGSYVVFKNGKGDLVQLPKKIIDFDKSALATKADEERRKAAAEAAAAAKKQKPVKKSISMSEIADYVEENRTKDNPANTSLAVSVDDLEKYSKNNPRPTGREAAVDYSYLEDKENNATNAQDWSVEYTRLSGEITQLKTRIDAVERTRDLASQETYLSDDPTDLHFRQKENAEKQLVELNKELSAKEERLGVVKRKARAQGVKNADVVAKKKERVRQKTEKQRPKRDNGN